MAELESSTKNEDYKYYNFLINASNQASLTGTHKKSLTQINSLFVIVSPYYIEKFNIEELNLDLKFDEQGTIWVNDNQMEAIEIEPGVKIFGISKHRVEE
jgi:hypothetical protein